MALCTKHGAVVSLLQHSTHKHEDTARAQGFSSLILSWLDTVQKGTVLHSVHSSDLHKDLGTAN